MTSDASCWSLCHGRCRGHDGLDFFFAFPRRFEALRWRSGCQGGTGLQAAVAFDGVFAVVFSASANFFNSAWLCCWAAVTSDASCRSLVRGRCRGRDGLDLLFGFPRRFEVPRQRFGCQGGTGLQASVSLDGVSAVVVFTDAIFSTSLITVP